MASSGEVGCAYAALILGDEGLEITADKIAAVLGAANVTVEAYWPGLFAKAVEGQNIKEMLANIGAGGGGGGGGPEQSMLQLVEVSAPAVHVPSPQQYDAVTGPVEHDRVGSEHRASEQVTVEPQQYRFDGFPPVTPLQSLGQLEQSSPAPVSQMLLPQTAPDVVPPMQSAELVQSSPASQIPFPLHGVIGVLGHPQAGTEVVWPTSFGQASLQSGVPSPSESVSATPQPHAPGAVLLGSLAHASLQSAVPSPSESVSALPQPHWPAAVLDASAGQPSTQSAVPSPSESVSATSQPHSPGGLPALRVPVGQLTVVVCTRILYVPTEAYAGNSGPL
eukprot:m.262484 g.262484  ORF g.262484 m.262484 type:complete len:335 (-) comp16004_c0_seq12:4410-5414(-)